MLGEMIGQGEMKIMAYSTDILDFLSIGCKVGQEVLTQMRVEETSIFGRFKKSITWLYVYDKKSKELIGRIRLE